MLRVPHQNGREDQQRHDGTGVRPRRSQPGPQPRRRQQEHEHARKQERPVQLRQHGEPRRGTPDEPEQRALPRHEQHARDRVGAARQRGIEWAVGQHPGAAGPGDDRWQVHRDRRPQSRAQAIEQAGEAVGKPRRQPEGSDEGQAHEHGCFRARYSARDPGHPPRERRVVEIAHLQLTARGDRIGLVDAEPQAAREHEAQKACAGDED